MSESVNEMSEGVLLTFVLNKTRVKESGDTIGMVIGKETKMC